MAGPLSPELARLLAARDATAQETAWAEFAQAYSRLLLHVARSIGRDYDAAMDAYAFVLERLREDGFRRLRCYTADGKTKFTTWLVVVARRLCLDHHRERYGRLRTSDPEGVRAHDSRRRLQDLIAADLDLAIDPGDDVQEGLEARERRAKLVAALNTLASRDRLLLKLRYEDDLPAREIAGVLGLPTPFHVYRRLKSLLRELRQTLRDHGLDGTST